MPEAITKYAINSSLGTENFKPLDVQIAEQVRLIPSDEIYQSFERFEAPTPPKTYDNEFVLPYKLKMTRKGTARFKVVINTGAIRNTYGTFTILKNNVAIKTTNFTNEFGDYLFNFSVDGIFNIGDVFTFKLVASNSHYEMRSDMFVDINLCGTLKQDIFDFVE